VAFARLNKPAEAEKEQAAWTNTVAKIPPETMYDDLNTTGAVFKVHEKFLGGAIATARQDAQTAVAALNEAVAAEDALNYSEPPPWYPPVRPVLGRLLLGQNQPAEAEKVFRLDLEKSPRDARALAGLRDVLKVQNREYEARQIDQQYRAAWKVAVASSKSAAP
jgi:Flp pilus assembly protein TadD